MMGPAVALIGDAQLGGDDVGEAGLAHAGRAEEQHVVERLAAAARGLDGHPQVRHHVGLADVLVEGRAAAATGRSRASSSPGRAGDEARLGHGGSAPGDDAAGRGAGGPRSGRAVLAQGAVDARSASARE